MNMRDMRRWLEPGFILETVYPHTWSQIISASGLGFIFIRIVCNWSQDRSCPRIAVVPGPFAATGSLRHSNLGTVVSLVETRKVSNFHWSQNTFSSCPEGKALWVKRKQIYLLVKEFGIVLLLWNRSFSAAVGPTKYRGLRYHWPLYPLSKGVAHNHCGTAVASHLVVLDIGQCGPLRIKLELGRLTNKTTFSTTERVTTAALELQALTARLQELYAKRTCN